MCIRGLTAGGNAACSTGSWPCSFTASRTGKEGSVWKCGGTQSTTEKGQQEQAGLHGARALLGALLSTTDRAVRSKQTLLFPMYNWGKHLYTHLPPTTSQSACPALLRPTGTCKRDKQLCTTDPLETCAAQPWASLAAVRCDSSTASQCCKDASYAAE